MGKSKVLKSKVLCTEYCELFQTMAGTVNPKWNEPFDFTVTNVDTDKLEATVFDRDPIFSKVNEYHLP